MNRFRNLQRHSPPTSVSAVSALAATLLIASCGGASASGDGADHAAQPNSTATASHPGSPPHEHAFDTEPESAQAGHGHHHGGPLGHRFEDADAWAARWEGPTRDAWQKPEAVVELMNIEPGMTVVDLGTGTGYFVPHLSKAVGPEGKVLALDIEASMVAHVTERAKQDGLANVTARKVAYDDPGLEPGSVDRVLCVNTWHHIPGRVDYARKLYAGLVEGGSFFLVDFLPEGDHGPPPQSRIAPEAAIAELSAAGFVAKIVSSPLTEQYVVQGTR